MRFYKTTYTDDAAEPGRTECAAWSTTQADAAGDRRRLKTAGMCDVATEEVDVPTDKKGLLEFLSKWCVVR